MHGVSRTSSRRKRILIAFIILHKHNVLLLSWVHTNTRKVFTDSKHVLLLSVWPPAASYCSASDTWTVGYHYIEQPCKDLHSYMFHMIRHIWGRWMIGERLDVLYYHKDQPLTICVTSPVDFIYNSSGRPTVSDFVVFFDQINATLRTISVANLATFQTHLATFF